MGWVDSGDLYGEVILDLVNGYLPQKDMLLELAKRSTTFAFQGVIDGENWSMDNIYQELGDSLRHSFCTRLKAPPVRAKGYCEAWLLNPQRNPGPEFKLKTRKSKKADRRLLLTLHYDCEAGKLCLQNLLEQTHFDVIPEDTYRDYAAFEKAAKSLFEVASVPFLAPCIVAQRKMEKCSYRCVGFGR